MQEDSYHRAMKLSLASLLALLLLAVALGTHPSQADPGPAKEDARQRNGMNIAEEVDRARSFGPGDHVLYRRTKTIGTGSPLTDRPRWKTSMDRYRSFIRFPNPRRTRRRGLGRRYSVFRSTKQAAG
ncbi:hypothetical protein O3P69_007088 [Scylla paramamosain]|uniref:Uncharacterized protein n=1 Tax=Scylla paramamosain TaxID=85552 RepID=A0AAW0V1B1_SCYPA